MLDRKAYARIHVLLKEKNIPDEIYRVILYSNFGVESSKDLNWVQYVKLLKILKNNFKSVSKPNKKKTNEITEKQKEYIFDLLNSLGTIYNTAKYVSRIIHREVNNISELTKHEAAIVIRCLRRKKHAR